MQDIQIFYLAAGASVAGNAYIQAAFVIINKMDANIVLIELVIASKVFLELRHELFNLAGGAAIGQAQSEVNAPLFAHGKIGDGRITQKRVGHIHQLLGKGADTGAAEGNLFYDAFNAVG